MCRLFETIRIVNGIPMHLRWHEERMLRSGYGSRLTAHAPRLDDLIKVPEEMRRGTVRCNVFYTTEILEITFTHYVRRHVKSLKTVDAGSLDYHLKFADRSGLQALFEMRGECDDIMIVKDGLITDASMANLIFFDGLNWHTPAKPLLEGSCRARLLAEGRITTADIRVGDLSLYLGCKLINAMRDPEQEEIIPASGICR